MMLARVRLRLSARLIIMILDGRKPCRARAVTVNADTVVLYGPTRHDRFSTYPYGHGLQDGTANRSGSWIIFKIERGLVVSYRK
jgi:hypothetical protein